MHERQAAVIGEERQAEQPGDRQHHRQRDQQQRRCAEAEQRQPFAQLVAAQAARVGRLVVRARGLRERGHPYAASSATSTASCALKPKGATSPTAGTRPRPLAVAMPRALMRLPSGRTRLHEERVALVDDVGDPRVEHVVAVAALAVAEAHALGTQHQQHPPSGAGHDGDLQRLAGAAAHAAVGSRPRGSSTRR